MGGRATVGIFGWRVAKQDLPWDRNCNRFLHDSGVDRVGSSCIISAFRSRRKAAGAENNSEEKG